MNIILAKLFNSYLTESLENDIDNALSAYPQDTTWTNYLCKTINEILIQKFNLNTSKEYLRIDMIGWIGNEAWNGKGNINANLKSEVNQYYWNIEIAMEYENSPKIGQMKS